MGKHVASLEADAPGALNMAAREERPRRRLFSSAGCSKDAPSDVLSATAAETTKAVREAHVISKALEAAACGNMSNGCLHNNHRH